MIDENKFWDLIRKWEFDTKYASSATQVLGHTSVAALIQMGPEIIPLALKAMKDNYHLAFVLHKLTGDWPVKDEHKGNGPAIISAWRKWAHRHGYQV